MILHDQNLFCIFLWDNKSLKKSSNLNISEGKNSYYLCYVGGVNRVLKNKPRNIVEFRYTKFETQFLTGEIHGLPTDLPPEHPPSLFPKRGPFPERILAEDLRHDEIPEVPHSVDAVRSTDADAAAPGAAARWRSVGKEGKVAGVADHPPNSEPGVASGSQTFDFTGTRVRKSIDGRW